MRARCVLAALWLISAGALAAEGYWYSGFAAPGVEGQVYAAIEHECDLIAGGQFTVEAVDGSNIRNVARWDGVKWSRLGEDLPGGQVRALLAHAGVIYAGGSFNFTNDLGETVRRIAYFDGANWRPIGEGLAGGSSVRALAILDGDLVAGGFFTTSGGTSVLRVARWNGKSWKPMGAGLNDAVHALTVLQGTLYAGGQFTDDGAGSTSGFLRRLARWDGDAWEAVEQGIEDGAVFALLPDDDDGALVVGGSFTEIGGEPGTINRLARWSPVDGWSGFDDGLNNDVLAIAELHGDLIAAGRFSRADVNGLNVPASRVARWDGFQWSQLGDGVTNGGAPGLSQCNALAVWAGRIVAGGSFFIAGERTANSIATWDSAAWAALGRTAGPGSLSGAVRGLASHEGSLYVGGSFSHAGAQRVNSVTMLAGQEWAPLIDGVNDTVYAFLPSPEGLYVGGAFTAQINSDGSNTFYRRAARWDGSSWSSLEDGPGDSISWVVRAITEWNDQIVIGGEFQSAGGEVVNAITIWNGQSYAAIGAPPGMNGPVLALAAYDGLLIAGGEFTQAGGAPCANIASWDGAVWSPLGPGLNGAVNALLVHDGRLIAGGAFTNDGDDLETLRRIASWDGAQWAAIDQGMNNEVDALCVYAGDLVAAGRFTQAGGVSANRVARVQDGLWRRLGLGVNDRARALAVHNDELYVGGDFTTAGARPSPFLARWSESPFEDPVQVPTNGVASSIAVAPIDDAPDSQSAPLDLAIANIDTDSVTIVRNLGLDGSSGAWLGFELAPASYPVGDQPISVITTDWNGDQRPDVLAAHAADSFVSILLNDGSGAMMDGGQVALPGPASWIGVVSRDDDKDLDDIAATIPMMNIVVTAPGGGGGATQSWPVGQGPSAVASADFNLDDIPDLAVSNELSGDVSLLLGLGAGQYAPEVRFDASELCAAPGTVALSAADVNADGWTDLVLANRASDGVAILLNAGDDPQGWLGFALPMTLSVGISPASVVAGDFDDSGLLDLVSANTGQDSLSFLRNSPGGEFESPVEIDVSPAPVFVTAADFDDDGQLDLISASASGARGAGGGSVEIRLNAGPAPTVAPPCQGDANGDLIVNFTDLNAVLFSFGSVGDDLPGDLNGSGVVGFEDLNAVLVSFGTDCLQD